MYCAAELELLKRKVENDYILEQKRLDEECEKRHLKRVERTVKFCDTVINNELVNCILKREKPQYSMRGCTRTDRLGNEYFSLLEYEGVKYANGEKSYRISCQEEDIFDLKTMKEYLNKHCITMIVNRIHFKRYGSGAFIGEEIKIVI